METGKFANWLQIFGNLGLIAGLVLVAVQIQQNTDATRAQMISDGIGEHIRLKLAVVGEGAAQALSTSIDAPSELSTEEMVVLRNLQVANAFNAIRNEYIVGLGYGVDTSDEINITGTARATLYEFLGEPFGYAQWDRSKSGIWASAPKTAAAIEAELAPLGAQHRSFYAAELELLREAISKGQPSG